MSGAVFLLPVQLSLLGVPSPAVTPTNLLFNVVAGPGALWRYRRDGALRGGLAQRLIAWTLPGVLVGATIRVFALLAPASSASWSLRSCCRSASDCACAP